MTNSELQTRFKIKFDKIDSFNHPELSPEQIDEMLNIAQVKLIDLIQKEGIEKNQKNTDYLKNIIVPFRATSFSGSSLSKPGSVTVDLPLDYRTCLWEEVMISYLDCNGTSQTDFIKVVPITRDRYNDIMKDPFNKPGRDKVENKAYRLTASKPMGSLHERFEIMTGNLGVLAYNMDYIKQPNKIKFGSAYSTPTTDVECELSEAAQEKVIDLAVLEAFEILGLNDQYTIKKQEELENK